MPNPPDGWLLAGNPGGQVRRPVDPDGGLIARMVKLFADGPALGYVTLIWMVAGISVPSSDVTFTATL